MVNNRILILRTAAFKTPRLTKQARTLADQGYSVDILYWNRGIDEEDNKIKAEKIKKEIGGNIYEIKTRRSLYGRGVFNFYPRGCYIIKVFIFLVRNGKKYSVIHAIDFDSAFPVFLYKFFNKKIKFVYDIADFIESYSSPIPNFIRRVIRILDKKIMKRANAIILPDENRIQNIPLHLRHKVYIVNNALDINLEKIKKTSKTISLKNPDKINLIYYGAFSRDRGIKILLESAEKTKDKIDFYFAGWGELEWLIKKYSKKLSNVFYLGLLNQDKVLSYLSLMDISCIVYSPAYEHNRLASPNKLFEAIILGKPVIVAKGTSIDKIVKDHNLGYVIKYEKEDLLNVLQNLRKKTLNRKIGAVRKIFGWEESKKMLISLYNKLLI